VYFFGLGFSVGHLSGKISADTLDPKFRKKKSLPFLHW